MPAPHARSSFYVASRRLLPGRYRARVVLVAGGASAVSLFVLLAGLIASGAGPMAALWFAVAACVASVGLMALWALLRPVAELAEALDHVAPGARPARSDARRDEVERISHGVEMLGRRLDVALREGDPALRDDPLTGLPNRLSVMRRARDEITRCRRKGAPLAVALFDLVDVGLLRKRDGAVAADDALRRTAEALTEALRAYDVVGRWEGDVFVALMPEAEVEHAVGAMRRARDAVAKAEAAVIEGLVLTGVAGVAVLQPEDATLADIAARAERALARARAGFGGGVEAAPGPRSRPATLTSV